MLMYDKSGADVSGAVGPLEEGAALVLICEVRGGKSWFNITKGEFYCLSVRIKFENKLRKYFTVRYKPHHCRWQVKMPYLINNWKTEDW